MKRLLVVDDQVGVTDFIQEVAEQQGYEVRSANRISDFMESFVQIRPDVVFLDLSMPEGGGAELMRWLADQGCQSRIVIISGHDQQVLASAARLGEEHKLKISATLSKPIRLAVLRDTLTRIENEA
jgi:DNA-binding NtrC family response regulator